MWIGTEAGERSEITQASFVQGLLELVSEHTTDISRNLLTCTLKVGCCRASRGVPVSSEVSPPEPHRISVLGWSVPITVICSVVQPIPS